MSEPVTLPCPRIGMHTNFVKAFSSAASVRTAAEFMCFPRVIETPIPKNSTPNRARFIRSARSCSWSSVSPVSTALASSTLCFLRRARSVVSTSKSLPGLIWRKRSAALALGLAGDVAEPVDQRHVRLVQEVGRRLDGGLHRGGLPVDQRIGEQAFGRVVLEPGITEAAGVPGLDDSIALRVQLDVVTDT